MNILKIICKLFKKPESVTTAVAEEDLIVFAPQCIMHIAISRSAVDENGTVSYLKCSQCDHANHCLVVKDHDKLLDK